MKLLAILLGASFSLSAANYFVTVVGLPGAPEYESQFASWAADLNKQLESGNPDVHAITLGSAVSAGQAYRNADSSRGRTERG